MKISNTIGVDIGFGYTKVYGDHGLSQAFPSQVTKMKQRGAFGKEPRTVTVNGHPFVVGNDIDAFGDFSVGSEFLGTPEYMALLGQALALSPRPCTTLVLGLPPGLFDEARITKLKRIISMTSLHSRGSVLRIPKSIYFVPQGAGIYFDYVNMLQKRGQEIKPNIVIIDLGHFTLDIVLFSHDEYQAGACRSYPLGVSKLFNDVKALFAKTHGVFLNNDDNALNLILDGSFTHFGKTYALDVKPLLDEYIHQKVLKAVGNYAAELRESSKISVNEIVVGGGGVRCIEEISGTATVVDDPQMSNARGYYQYGIRQTEAREEVSPVHACVNA